MASGHLPVHHRVDGPFSYHLYLGFCVDDMPLMVELQRSLEKHSIICFPRCDASKKDISYQTMIQDGINCSRKCLVYLSDQYLRDLHFTLESNRVLNKSKRFSRDMVIILQDPHMTSSCPTFKGLVPSTFGREHLNDPAYMSKLIETVLKEPNPSLALMPKENIGYGSALGYFYGYLRLVLPDFRKRLETQTLASDPELLEKTVKKMLIIMPETCFCPPELTKSGKIEHTEKFVLKTAHRAGNRKRDYKSSLYKIYDLQDGEQNKKEYYFVAELATPLLTMFESYHFGLAQLSREQLYAERDAFYISLKAILDHHNNEECNEQFKLLFWASDPGPPPHNDDDPNSAPVTAQTNSVSVYDFLLPIIRDELQQQSLDGVREAVKPRTLQTDDVCEQHPVSHDGAHDTLGFISVDSPGSNPAALYEDSLFGYYKLDSRPRGICLIINIANFDKGPELLHPRRGADADEKALKTLFEKRHFDVKVHNDLDKQTLESLLLTMSLVDHSNYDAFVCCFLTHGKLGVLYTADVKPIRIVDITEYFNDQQCPSLSGKPKLFFIQACQKGAEHGDAETVPAPSVQDQSTGTRTTDGSASTHREAIESPPKPASTLSSTECAEYEGLLDIDGAAPLDWDANVAPTLLAANERGRTTWLESKATLIPGYPDFLMSYATLPGAVAYRDTLTGSLYVTELAKCLSEQMEIDRALKRVSGGVAKQLSDHNKQENNMSRFQLPFHLTSGMDKLLRL